MIGDTIGHTSSRVLAFALVIAASASPARADDALAAASFNQAEALATQGKWVEACPFYEASYKEDPKLGTLFHLADCHERVGRFASAWIEFTDAADFAKQKADSREALAKSRADALVPKLSKLHINPPSKLIPSLAVRRDGTDVTILVGTDMPIDPGEHEISAIAPGFAEWKAKVSIGGPGLTSLNIPALDKLPDKPIEPPKVVVHEGMLRITTPQDAEIVLDSDHVGIGRYEGKVKSGGHTLRVTAPGMRPYQSEIVVLDDEVRTIDIPLEKDTGAVVVIAQPGESGPSFELGASLATGVKMRHDNPLVVSLRGELAFRIGQRVNFGMFAEYGSIQMSNACGFDMPGPTPSTPYDFGPRLQFTNCSYLMPGLQLYIHILPKGAVDPYFGLSPGFRFGFVEYKTYPAVMTVSEVFPAIVSGVRAGVNYHPTPGFRTWEVGGFVEAEITIIGDEASQEYKGSGGSKNTFVSLFGGLRTTLAF